MSKRTNYFLGDYPIGYGHHYAPKIMFQEDRGYDPELTKALIEARYSSQPPSFIPQFNSGRGREFIKNAGAVALYDKNNQRIGGALSSFSFPYRINGTATSYGHSERMGMRDILNYYIPDYRKQVRDSMISSGILPIDYYNTISDYLVPQPPNYYNTPDYFNSQEGAKDKEERLVAPPGLPSDLYNLVQKAPIYQDFLGEAGTTIKMLSERQDCNGESPGGNCSQFLNRILPDGSSYGFLVPRSSVSNEVNDVENFYSSGILDQYTAYKRQQEEARRTKDQLAYDKLTQQEKDQIEKRRVNAANILKKKEIEKRRLDAVNKLAAKRQRAQQPIITPFNTPDPSITPSSNMYGSMTSTSSPFFPGSQSSPRPPSFGSRAPSFGSSNMSTFSSPSSSSSFPPLQNPGQSPLRAPTTQYNNRSTFSGTHSNSSFSRPPNPSYAINPSGNYRTSSSLSSTMAPSFSQYRDPSSFSTSQSFFLPPDPQTPTLPFPPGYFPQPSNNSSSSSTSSSSTSYPYQRRKRGGVIGRLLNSYNYL